MLRYPDTVVLIFTKAPVAGKVNTRLIPDIGQDKATNLQDELIHHRIKQLSNAALCNVILYCSPDDAHASFQLAKKQYGIVLKTQKGNDLGERMYNALSDELIDAKKAIIIGTDAPALGVESIEKSIRTLGDSNFVIVPAEDGGYVLIGANKTNENIFSNVKWGSDAVLQTTKNNIEKNGMTVALLSTCWDIDRVEDYQRYLDWKKVVN